MKLAVFALVCFLGAFVAAEIEEEFQPNWNYITPIDRRVEPIGPAPVEGGIRIVGGGVATRGAFPYIVALVINNSGFCGGSIISKDYVLTAAHCAEDATSVQVIAGAHNPQTTNNEPNQVRLYATAKTIHGQWNTNTLQNDVALLKVNAIPVGSPGISAVALAPANAGNFAGSTATLSGWGRTSDSSNAIATELRTIQLPVLTNAVCRNSFGSTLGDQHICTSGANRRGACNGDSGGPLVIGNHQVGVVSFGSSQCEAGYPSAFARVSHFRNWISTNSGV